MSADPFKIVYPHLNNLIYFCLVGLCFACASQGPSAPKTAEEELATFVLAEDLNIELVAAEPLVQDPVCIAFDHLGRLWVAEMTGFNATLEGEGENNPIGKIVVLIDDDRDGRMDSRTVFLDSLVLPRSFAFVPGGLLVAERIPLWYVEDTDGDLRADRMTMVDSTYGGRGHVEHSPNGLLRGLDNWYYNAKSTMRYKRSGGVWIKDTTEFRGQWGISHDNYGRLYYNYNWSQLHADLVPPNYLNRNTQHEATTGIDHGLTLNRSVFPIRSTPAINRGYIDGTLDGAQKLLEFTSACSPFVFRGTALPAEMVGDVFVCEPAGNLIKRNQIKYDGYNISATDAYNRREFLASTDERFRPVFLTSGPDGALYVADMYRGLIEHWKYMTPYLKEKTIDRKLDVPHHLGRIWKISGKGDHLMEKMNDHSCEELVSMLLDDNGWKRDMAQRLLVEQGDSDCKELLVASLQGGVKPLGRLHALWTLEGMQMMNKELLVSALADQDPQVRMAAMRIFDQLHFSADEDGQDLLKWISANWETEPPEVVLQLLLSLGNLSASAVVPLMSKILYKYVDHPLMQDAVLSGLSERELEMYRWLIQQNAWSVQTRMHANIFEKLGSALGKRAEPSEVSYLLESLGNDVEDWQINSLLRGLILQLKQHEEPLVLEQTPSFVRNVDAFDVALKARIEDIKLCCEWPGHQIDRQERRAQASLTPGEQSLFALGRKHYLTSCAGCHNDDGSGLNRFAPPLVGSEWVLGDDRRLALVLLHGIEGPITVKGHLYEAPEILPVMPAHSILDDKVLAAIMTYIRNDWHNQAGAVKPGRVGHIRHRSQGRVQPWDVKDLTEHLAEVEAKQVQ